MKAYVTSIGESTTELCMWSLKRNGFDVVLLKNEDTSLADKLEEIYDTADDDFIRVDADVIVNKNCTITNVASSIPHKYFWAQYLTFDFYKQDITYGGVQYIRKDALPILQSNIGKFKTAERPESQMYRLQEFNKPRRCVSNHLVMGIHGYKQYDIERVKLTKKRRGRYAEYDWELYDKISQL